MKKMYFGQRRSGSRGEFEALPFLDICVQSVSDPHSSTAVGLQTDSNSIRSNYANEIRNHIGRDRDFAVRLFMVESASSIRAELSERKFMF